MGKRTQMWQFIDCASAVLVHGKPHEVEVAKSILDYVRLDSRRYPTRRQMQFVMSMYNRVMHDALSGYDVQASLSDPSPRVSERSRSQAS